MSKHPYRYKIYPSKSDVADIFQGDATGGFDLYLRRVVADELNCVAQRRNVHVVQHDAIRLGRESAADFVEVARFHKYGDMLLPVVRCGLAGTFYCGSRSPDRGRVILFDERLSLIHI